MLVAINSHKKSFPVRGRLAATRVPVDKRLFGVAKNRFNFDRQDRPRVPTG